MSSSPPPAPQQPFDKLVTLARNAQTSSEPALSVAFFQRAVTSRLEHTGGRKGDEELAECYEAMAECLVALGKGDEAMKAAEVSLGQANRVYSRTPPLRCELDAKRYLDLESNY